MPIKVIVKRNHFIYLGFVHWNVFENCRLIIENFIIRLPCFLAPYIKKVAKKPQLSYPYYIYIIPVKKVSRCP